MAILKIKDETGKFVDIPAIQGAPGKDGAIQYEAGENITIDGNVISASGGITLDDVKIITGELTNLSTEDKSSLVNAINEVANKGSDVEGNELAIYSLKINGLGSGNSIKSSDLPKIDEMINSLFQKGVKQFILRLTYDDSIDYDNGSYTEFIGYNNKLQIRENQTPIILYSLSNATLYNYSIRVGGTFNINGSWNNGVFKTSRAVFTYGTEYYLSSFLTSSTALTKTNTSEYMPTSDYNPATKKYVDDNKSKVPTFISASLPEYSASDNTSPSITNETELASLSDIINNFYKEGIASASLFVGNSNNTSSAILFSRGQVLNAKVETYKFWGIMPGWDSSTLRLGISLVVKGTWTDNAFTCTSAYFQTGTKYDLTSFAQKSYVDNAIANAITTSLEASY